MSGFDDDFTPQPERLRRALECLLNEPSELPLTQPWPHDFPEDGRSGDAIIDLLAPKVLGQAVKLGSPIAMAHMDPPTPWLAWAMTQWNARLNQNVLHPATSPVAREIESKVISWLAPSFGMTGGFMTGGATLSNLNALWAAREARGIKRVIASSAAHVSIAKAANILGLPMVKVPAHRTGAMDNSALPRDLSDAALVLTAGTTGTGAIDPLMVDTRAAWIHVDAAWAGPLIFTHYAERLEGIKRADSVAVSAHKLLFQPKDAALVFFRDSEQSLAAISADGAYLADANVGVQGSRGAVAIPLFATLLAWGRRGLKARLEHCMAASESLAAWIAGQRELELLADPVSGVVVWRIKKDDRSPKQLSFALPETMASQVDIDGETWIRQVAANPLVDVHQVITVIESELERRR